MRNLITKNTAVSGSYGNLHAAEEELNLIDKKMILRTSGLKNVKIVVKIVNNDKMIPLVYLLFGVKQKFS